MLELFEKHFLECSDPKDPAFAWRKKSWDQFCKLGWPTLQTEIFRYVPLHRLSWSGVATSRSSTPSKSAHITFIDGFFSEEFSQIPEGLICLPLDEALRSYGVFLQNRWTKSLKEETDPLAALNGALHGKGAFFYAPPGWRGKIEIAYVSQGSSMTMPRWVGYLGKEASLEVSVQNRSGSLMNSYGDILLDQGSFMTYREEGFSHTGSTFQSIRASLKKDARFNAHHYFEGACIARSSIRVQLLEENSETLLQGLGRLKGTSQNHVHTLVEHLAPHTRSRQHFKTVLNEESRSSFEGKIYVDPIAQKTQGYQINQNLLLSESAITYSKPNLEILADDVKASHGCTVAQLNAEDLFYLRSRGIPLEMAKHYLIEGFCRELSECIPRGEG